MANKKTKKQMFEQILAHTTDKAELLACANKLAEQKPLVQQYVMDQVYDLMENEEAWIAPYYAGDYFVMLENNEDLRFYLPEHQGFNMFIDAMCIPTCCKEKEAAELFINFLCDPEISGANMDYICYASPISEAKDYMEDYLAESDVVYPDEEILKRGTSYKFVSEEISRYVEGLYQAATKTGNDSESPDSSGGWILVAVLAVGLGGGAMLMTRKRKRY